MSSIGRSSVSESPPIFPLPFLTKLNIWRPTCYGFIVWWTAFRFLRFFGFLLKVTGELPTTTTISRMVFLSLVKSGADDLSEDS